MGGGRKFPGFHHFLDKNVREEVLKKNRKMASFFVFAFKKYLSGLCFVCKFVSLLSDITELFLDFLFFVLPYTFLFELTWRTVLCF